MARVGRHRWPLIIAGLALISPMFPVRLDAWVFIYTVGYTLLYLGYGCILVALVHTPVGEDGGVIGRWMQSAMAKGMATIGLFSYSIYLWHPDLRQPIEWLFGHRVFAALPLSVVWTAATASYSLLAIGVGIVMAKLIEFPCLALRDRLFPRRAGALRGAGTGADLTVNS